MSQEVDTVPLLLASAQHGNANQQYKLATHYEFSEKNYEKAYYWYEKAALSKHPEAIFSRGFCQFEGQGTELNENSAFESFKESAELGYDRARWWVAHCHYSGIGTEVDEARAFQMFLHLANQGVQIAQCSVAFCYRYSRGTDKDLSKAYSWYMTAAKSGYALAQKEVASFYFDGIYVDEDQFKAVHWYSKAAENGNSDAQFYLGKCYYFGNGVEEDNEQAFYWFQKAADKGMAEAQCYLGKCYYSGFGVEEDKDQAFYWYQKAAENGDSDAQFYLGKCYYFGINAGADKDQAFYWFQKAADQDLAIAQYYLGRCYYFGNGVEEDNDQAFYWFQKATDQDIIEAQCYLGKCYYYGFGVEEDKDQAFYWFHKAADKGMAEAQCHLGKCYYFGNGVEEDNDQAFYWLKKAADKGMAEAQYYLGECYCSGYGVKEDKDQAFYWYQKAAENGDSDAQLYLGKCYYFGNGVEEDNDQAFYWFKNAADKGIAEAQYYLGECYYSGYGIEEDEEQAFAWYLQAAEKGNALAQFEIGNCYFYGNNVTENKKLAELWLMKSAAQGNHDAENLLADLHEYDENYAESKKWHLKAAEGGNSSSRITVATNYESGRRGFPKNLEKSFFWWKRMADDNSRIGPYRVGIHFLLGLGVRQDQHIAYTWFERSITQFQSYHSAYYMMAVCYLMGIGVEKDKNLAFDNLEKGFSATYISEEKKVKTEHYESFIRYHLAEEYLRYEEYRSQGLESIKLEAKNGLALAQVKLADHYFCGKASFICDEHYKNDISEAYFWYKKAALQGHQRAAERCEFIEGRNPKIIQYVDEIFGTTYIGEINTRIRNTDSTVTECISPPEQEKKNIDSVSNISYGAINSLNALIGLSSVKKRVQALVNEIKLKNERSRRGLPVGQARSYHMIFTGNPGTGKTVVARIIAEVFYELGITKENKIIETDRSGLVGEYIGHTAVKTTEIINSAKGGVLFIDEAYALKGDGNDFGKEAIETLLKKMEDERENLIVIAAGYTNDMKELLDSNAGLASRFTRTIHFDDYSTSELLQIFEKIATDNGYFVDESSYDMISDSLERVKAEKAENFGNAREVRNLFEHAIQEQENRICNSEVDISSMCNDELQTLLPEDFSIFC